jgi:hypothetical protein
VRDLEAIRRLASGRAWAGVLISDAGPPTGLDPADPEGVAVTVAAGTPHLDELDRADVSGAYVGCLTTAQADAAVA